MRTHRAALAVVSAALAAAALTCVLQAQLQPAPWPPLASAAAERSGGDEAIFRPPPEQRNAGSTAPSLSSTESSAVALASAAAAREESSRGGSGSSWHHDKSLYELSVGADRRCGDDSQLAIAVISRADNFERRQAIRDTWLRWRREDDAAATTTGAATARLGRSVGYAFLLGTSASASVNERVHAESRVHGDVVQASFVDDYGNLTLKSIAMLLWARRSCPSAAHLLKVDDDVFVNLPFVDGLLASPGGRRLSSAIVGRILVGSRPVTDPTAKWYAGDGAYAAAPEYPPYASGPLYVVTADLVGPLLEQALRLPYLRIEDVFVTGVCAAAVSATASSTGSPLHRRVVHFHHPAVTDLRLPPSGCHFRNTANGHNYTSLEMRRIWADLVGGMTENGC